jgi:osmotically-inducible protein OsmY
MLLEKERAKGEKGMTRTFVSGMMLITLSITMLMACRQQTDDGADGDAAVAQAVRDQFAADQNTRGAMSRVRAEAKGGTVTLSGTVDTPEDKALAERLARQAGRVNRVVNQVSVSAPVLPAPDEPYEEQKVRAEAGSNGERVGPSSEDARIYHAIRRQIVRYESTPKRAIFVDVEDGNVTLRGMIGTTVARDEAVAAARKVEGAMAVQDKLLINTPAP